MPRSRESICKMKGKTALITGSTYGIGKAIAIKLAKKGANIVINYSRNEDEANKTADEIKQNNIDVLICKCDVSNYDSCKEMMEKIKEKFQKIDILVNNAGITRDKTLAKMSPEEWNTVINVNLNSLYNVTNNALEIMPDGSRIINIASIVGITGNFGQTNYSSSKAAVIGFTKSLAKELGKRKITVNAVAPGFIKSKMTDAIPMEMVANILALIPLKEMGKPEDVANVVSFLASDEARYITGSVLKVDGGMI